MYLVFPEFSRSSKSLILFKIKQLSAETHTNTPLSGETSPLGLVLNIHARMCPVFPQR